MNAENRHPERDAAARLTTRQCLPRGPPHQNLRLGPPILILQLSGRRRPSLHVQLSDGKQDQGTHGLRRQQSADPGYRRARRWFDYRQEA